jgi:NAD(P)-dependent dehydrogenase (short-subunit alcohol dehydrogenase family)
MTTQRKGVILITGASSGIGQACALHFAKQGYCVYGTSRRAAPDLQRDTFSMISMDVTNDASVERGVELVLAREGRIDVVVNNSGIAVAGAIENTSMAEAQEQLDVNFFGPVRVCRAVLPIMRRQQRGYIINIGSIGGLIGIPYQAMYSASKFALEGFTESLRLEARPFGIRVSLIEPGDQKKPLTFNRRRVLGSQGDQVYRKSFEAAIESMAHDEQNGPAPEGIASLLHRIIETPNPRLRYTIGPIAQRAAVFMKRLLPYAVTEYGMRAYYKLS